MVVGGSPDASNPTKLLRGQNLRCGIMELGRDANCIPTTVPLTNVTVQNLTFCGATIHRYDPEPPSYPNGNPAHPNGDPSNPCPIAQVQTTCEAAGNCDSLVLITSTAAGQSWAAPAQAPFNNMGPNNPYNVTIQNCKFEDSGGMLIAPEGIGQVVNDVYLFQNVISSDGIQIGAFNTSTNFDDYTQCDNWQAVNHTNFADDTTVALPRNIRFDNNTFYVNAGAVSGRGRYVQVTHNTINGYYWSTGGGGGAIEQETCADQVMITNNTLTGNWQSGSTGPSGLELYSRNLTVSGNTISGYSNEAIGLLSVYNATVTGNHLYNNNLQNLGHFAEIAIATRFPWPGTCHPGGFPCPAYRDTYVKTVQNNDSLNQPAGYIQYGIFFEAPDDGSTDNVQVDTITGNNISATGAQVACDQHVSANMCAPSVQVTSDPHPHAIAPFPEGTPPLGSPLGPGDPAQNGERFFRFGANDDGGPGNFNGIYCIPNTNPLYCEYASIQGIFDAVADPTKFGLGGPYATQAACHFVYFPATKTIYLDAPSANSTFTGGSSVVGSGGGSIDNGICKINAGNSTQTTGQQYIELVLDIAFHQAGTWYIYEVANNSQGAGSFSDQDGIAGNWSLWGYWPVTSPQ